MSTLCIRNNVGVFYLELGGREQMKRIFDFMLSLLVLVILSPIFILLALLIKLDDPKGPVLFVQKRLGKDEKIFNMYKFRTMKIGTPEVATDLLTDRDKYITGVGRFMRKASLDELPNLLNILKGEMSFVGPRPALYNQYELIEKRRARGINKIIPGLTGLAQINGRDNIEDDEKVMYDEHYLKEKSFLRDLEIIFKTFSQVASGKDIR